jgi:hypothetical protein
MITASLVVAPLVACTVEGPQGPSGIGESSAVTSAEGDDDPSDLLDLGAGDSGTAAADDGGDVDTCRKMDFVFVIDSSLSMSDEQESLIASFPGFVETIQSVTAVSDYHLMVLDTDAFAISQELEWSICTPAPGCCDGWCAGQVDNPVSVCNGYPCAMPQSCEDRLGGGRVHDPWGGTCGVGEGRGYIDSAGDPLPSAFECIASLGTQGYVDEKPLEALTLALAPEAVGDGGCNAGFLRKDALLVVVLITDEDDAPEGEDEECARGYSGSQGGPAAWFDAVAAAKGGIERDVVVLSVVGPPDGSCPALDKCSGGITGAEPALRIADFTGRFSHGTIGSVCAPSYDGFFQDAVGVVSQACLEFEPVP